MPLQYFFFLKHVQDKRLFFHQEELFYFLQRFSLTLRNFPELYINQILLLNLELYDLEEDKSIHKFMHTVTIATQSEVEENKRGLLTLVISIIILIVAGLTLYFSIRQYRLSKQKINNNQDQPILEETEEIKEEATQANKE